MTGYEKTREFSFGVTVAVAVVGWVFAILTFACFSDQVKQIRELKRQLHCSEECIK